MVGIMTCGVMVNWSDGMNHEAPAVCEWPGATVEIMTPGVRMDWSDGRNHEAHAACG